MAEMLSGRSRRYEPWIGVDLDATLAMHNEGDDVNSIGAPVPGMVMKVRRAQAAGKKVKIFTARAVDKKQIPMIQAWARKAGLGDMEVTNEKDPGCEEIWDNAARRVVSNKGKFQ